MNAELRTNIAFALSVLSHTGHFDKCHPAPLHQARRPSTRAMIHIALVRARSLAMAGL